MTSHLPRALLVPGRRRPGAFRLFRNTRAGRGTTNGLHECHAHLHGYGTAHMFYEDGMWRWSMTKENLKGCKK